MKDVSVLLSSYIFQIRQVGQHTAEHLQVSERVKVEQEISRREDK